VRARSWHLEFREMVLKATVYNLRRSVRYPWNRPPCTETTEPHQPWWRWLRY